MIYSTYKSFGYYITNCLSRIKTHPSEPNLCSKNRAKFAGFVRKERPNWTLSLYILWLAWRNGRQK